MKEEISLRTHASDLQLARLGCLNIGCGACGAGIHMLEYDLSSKHDLRRPTMNDEIKSYKFRQ